MTIDPIDTDRPTPTERPPLERSRLERPLDPNANGIEPLFDVAVDTSHVNDSEQARADRLENQADAETAADVRTVFVEGVSG